jgi:hypothetical protein
MMLVVQRGIAGLGRGLERARTFHTQRMNSRSYLFRLSVAILVWLLAILLCLIFH